MTKGKEQMGAGMSANEVILGKDNFITDLWGFFCLFCFVLFLFWPCFRHVEVPGARD